MNCLKTHHLKNLNSKEKNLQIEKSFQFKILKYQYIESEKSVLTSVSVII